MTIDPLALVAILAMAAVTYLTRIAGFLAAGRIRLSGRAKAAFDAIPPAVLVAVIAPTVDDGVSATTGLTSSASVDVEWLSVPDSPATMIRLTGSAGGRSP